MCHILLLSNVKNEDEEKHLSAHVHIHTHKSQIWSYLNSGSKKLDALSKQVIRSKKIKIKILIQYTDLLLLLKYQVSENLKLYLSKFQNLYVLKTLQIFVNHDFSVI
jgi:hypothetical protein